ncbi:lysozyme g-like isoform X1 [Aquarana catesbeiana]|uniref:lysozyme g-like isoform X1 n=1 Tax=Aquarana catesbeiana TaxID=8400 RepID=UPI003CC95ABD
MFHAYVSPLGAVLSTHRLMLETVTVSGANTSSFSSGQNSRSSGIEASEKLAETDLKRVNSYREKITSVSRKTGVDPAIIAAIMSRESRAGNALDANKWGDHGNAYGLMQIDKRWHTPQGEWDSEEHILQATEILCNMFDAIKQNFPSWSTNQVMKGAISAYNAGPGNVISFDTIDSRTTGRDYSNDVVARAKFYKKNGF